MTVAVVVAVLGMLGVVGGAWFTYAAKKRLNSGTTRTSSATDLWEEGRSQRTELREDLEKAVDRNEIISGKLDVANVKLDAALVQIAQLLHEVELAHAASDQAREDVRRSRAETAKSRAETKALAEQIAAVHADVATVHDEVITGNAQTIGALVDQVESRRIALIPVGERTSTERDHIDSVEVDRGHDHKEPE